MDNLFLSHVDAAARNRNSVLHYIKMHKHVSRTDIFENMNISRASITQVIGHLQERGLVVETGEGESTGGRKAMHLSFNGAAKKVYAFDWVSRVLCLMDLGGNVLYEKELSFENGVKPMSFAANIKREIAQIDAMKLCSEEEIIGFGISLPGQIDSRTGTVLYSVELGWQNVSLKGLFADRFGCSVHLERTGNLMALGEYAHCKSKKCTHFQLYILGTDGIGVSTIIHGNCQHGANYMHGELGHIKVPEETVCSCGQRGCLEAVVNDLLMKSDGVLTEQVLEYLSIGVSTSLNISDVDTALIVGSYVQQMTQEQRDDLVLRIRDKVTSQHMRKLKIRFAFDTKALTLQGISEYLFDVFFPIG